MTQELDLSVVVPILDERECLATLTQEIEEALLPLQMSFELLLVNDASTDGGLQTMQNLAAAHPWIRVLGFEQTQGQSAALMTGFRASMGGVVVTLDGDLQNDPADIPRLLQALDGNDLVSGIRAIRQDTWTRKVSSRIANSVRRFFLGDSITDIGCALKAYRREWLVDLPPFDGLHRFLPAILEHRGARVAEVRIHHRPRIHGRSKYGVHNRLWRGMADLLGVSWLESRRIRPAWVRELSEVRHPYEMEADPNKAPECDEKVAWPGLPGLAGPAGAPPECT